LKEFRFAPGAGFRLVEADRGADAALRKRRISFEQIVASIESSKLIQVLEHPNAERYPNQLLYEVDVDGYVHVVPVVREGRVLLLTTIYPSRRATRRRSKGEPA
jgi:hypothetical protein